MSARQKIAKVFLIAFLLSGCGGTAMKRLAHIDENSAFVQIIINDNEIKDKKDGSKFVDAIKKSFSHSFKNVSVRTGYDSPKGGELVVMPQSLSLDTNYEWRPAAKEVYKATARSEEHTSELQ